MEILLGTVEDYFAHVGVATLKLKKELAVGDTIRINGHTTELTQVAESMQIDHKPVNAAKSGDDIGIKVNDRVRKGDQVFKIVND
ncbi:MAG: translation elongation factor-like protein [Elusimicrobiota bacterium]